MRQMLGPMCGKNRRTMFRVVSDADRRLSIGVRPDVNAYFEERLDRHETGRTRWLARSGSPAVAESRVRPIEFQNLADMSGPNLFPCRRDGRRWHLDDAEPNLRSPLARGGLRQNQRRDSGGGADGALDGFHGDADAVFVGHRCRQVSRFRPDVVAEDRFDSVGDLADGEGQRADAQRPDLAPGAGKNPVTGDPHGWIDTTAFRRPEPGFQGNLGRNTITGPSTANTDFSLAKTFPLSRLRDGASMEFRAEFFNLFNHSNFDLPQPSRMEVFTADSVREDAGRITSAGPSREVQLGLRIRF